MYKQDPSILAIYSHRPTAENSASSVWE